MTSENNVGRVIPYKNPCALIAYYMGIGALIPCLGIPLGALAFILGLIGLFIRYKNPAVKGSLHAWIGVIVGSLSIVIQIGITVYFLMTDSEVQRWWSQLWS